MMIDYWLLKEWGLHSSNRMGDFGYASFQITHFEISETRNHYTNTIKKLWITHCTFSSLDVWLWYLPVMNEGLSIYKSLHKHAVGPLLLLWEMNKTFSFRKIMHWSLICGDMLLILTPDRCKYIHLWHHNMETPLSFVFYLVTGYLFSLNLFLWNDWLWISSFNNPLFP